MLREALELLRHDAEAHRLADLDKAGRWAQASAHDLQQAGFTGAVFPEDADAVPWADDPIDIREHLVAAEGHANALQLYNLLSEARHSEALELDAVAQRRIVRKQRPGGIDTELRLAGARLRPMRKPVELFAQDVLPALFCRRGLALALHALLHIG